MNKSELAISVVLFPQAEVVYWGWGGDGWITSC